MTIWQLLRPGLLAVSLLVAGCGNVSDNVLQGWIEGDFIFISPDEQGRIEQMLVRQGDAVKKGQLLFVLDNDLQEADLGVASGNGKGQIFVKGEVIKTVPEAAIVETLIEEAMRLAESMEGAGDPTVSVG